MINSVCVCVCLCVFVCDGGTQHMHKQRLDLNGRPKADKVKEEANVVETSAKEASERASAIARATHRARHTPRTPHRARHTPRATHRHDTTPREQHHDPPAPPQAPALDPDYCGSCYGADTAEQPCCNTCESVVTAYNGKGWSVADVERTAEQCVREKHDPLSAVQKGEGCNLAGWLEARQRGW